MRLVLSLIAIILFFSFFILYENKDETEKITIYNFITKFFNLLYNFFSYLINILFYAIKEFNKVDFNAKIGGGMGDKSQVFIK